MTSAHPFRLALVSMPWAIFNRPSVQLGALKSYIEAHSEVKVRTLHPYLGVARLLGRDLYHFISANIWICEALYSAILFPELRADARRVAEEEAGRAENGVAFDFDATCAQLERHLADWVAAGDWQHYDLAGFSVCFNQLLATLAAVSVLKKAHPRLPVVLGGSSCPADFGPALFAHFPVDFLISGEGEEALLNLCAFLAGRSATLADNISSAAAPGRAGTSCGGRQLEVAGLPCPDYDDYFREMQSQFGGEPFIPVIPVEFSRGCWWRRCTFCNLNLQWRGYRHKPAEKMAAEVLALAGRHKALDFVFTDNALPPRDALAFFATMADTGMDFRFFAEVRADQRGRAMEISRRGGLTSVQVGIEALSNSLLAKMVKGVTVLDNLAIMKDALANGVVLDGNLIVEFPGSTDEEVRETLANLDFAFPFHPLTTAAFFLGHGSPVDEEPKKYGIRARTMHHHAARLFPGEIGAKLVLLIKDFRGDRAGQRQRWAPVVSKVKKWRQYHRQRNNPARLLLCYRDGGDFLIIRQELPDGRVLHHRLRGISRQIYLACEAINDLPALAGMFPAFTSRQIENFLADLAAKRLVFREQDRFLALAVRRQTC
ncbi:MAG: RiPP maturation radical SAM C-methyltransferase [Thermodesulfobacteriota bacterium]